MTHLEVQHKADIFKRQIIQRSAFPFSNPSLVLKSILTSFPVSTPWLWPHFSLCDRRFTPGLEFPASRTLPDSLFTIGTSPFIFTFLLQSVLLPQFSSLYDLNSFLFSILCSCTSIILFTVLCFLLCRRQNLSPEALRSSLSKMDARSGEFVWTEMDTQAGRG